MTNVQNICRIRRHKLDLNALALPELRATKSVSLHCTVSTTVVRCRRQIKINKTGASDFGTFEQRIVLQKSSDRRGDVAALRAMFWPALKRPDTQNRRDSGHAPGR